MKKIFTILALTIVFSVNAQIATTGTVNSGTHSTAMGYYTTASGIASTAMGESATASGYVSTAMGAYTTASGYNSTAMGYYTTASGYDSTAMGYFTTASGDDSTAMGAYTTASDYGSLVIGQYNSSGSTVTSSAYSFNTANTAFVIGNGADTDNKADAFKVMFNGDTYVSSSLYLGGTKITSTATELNLLSGATSLGTGILSPVIENSNTGVRLSTAVADNYGDIGYNAVDLSYSPSASTTNGATGNYSTAMGYETTASGYISTAMGRLTKASGGYSTAMGYETTATNFSSTAMGYYTTASGYESTAMGTNTTASGIRSTAMGSGSTEASGDYSTAMGYSTTASGYESTAMGDNTTASGIRSTAMGSGTEASGSTSTAMGFETTASDFGSLVIGQYNSSGSSVTSNATSFDTANTAFVIGNGADTDNKADAFKVMFNGKTTVGDDLEVKGSVLVSSDARLKANIVSLGATLAKLLLIDGKSYTMKKDGKQKIGVLAQDIQKVFPELVSTDDRDMLAVNYQGLVPVLINALKEQQAEIDELKKQDATMKEQEKRLERLEAIISKMDK